MIFLTLGTQKFQFDRILQYIDEKIESKEIEEEVFAQIGNSTYIPKYYKYVRFLEKNKFEEMMLNSNLIISHAGVGTIVAALKLNKKIIIVPRLVEFGEHVDNHQVEIAEMFEKRNLIISNGKDINNLVQSIKNIDKINLNKYQSSNEKIQNIIEKFIEENRKNEKINVLMIGSDYKSVKGGIATVIKNYAEYNKWENIKLKFVFTHRDKSKVYKMLYFFVSLLRIDLNLIFKKYDVVHIHVSERGSIFRKNIIIKHIKKISKNTKIILHHHGAEFDLEYEKMDDKNKKVVKQMLKNADVNIVLSNRLVSSIKNKEKDANVEVLYNAVNTYEKNKYKNGNILLFLGRLGKRKGVYDFIDVLKDIKSEIVKKNLSVYLCGDGETDKIKDIVEKNKLNDVVKHIGWIDSIQKKEILENSLINILPSYNEGLPMTILETMSYGIPNISTDIASIPEVIKDDITGYLIKPGDKEMLKEKILYLMENESKRKEISENSYQLILEQFSLDSNIRKLKEIYNS